MKPIEARHATEAVAFRHDFFEPPEFDSGSGGMRLRPELTGGKNENTRR